MDRKSSDQFRVTLMCRKIRKNTPMATRAPHQHNYSTTCRGKHHTVGQIGNEKIAYINALMWLGELFFKEPEYEQSSLAR